jgi:pimeloyl-ACP methyl ester carboxylesterase
VPVEEHWQDAPEAHDFPAAADYLSLLAPAGEVTKVVAALRAAETVHYKAKDLLRASRLGLLSPDNIHVRKDLEKVAEGKRLSPVLVVRGRADKGVPLTIADGYHRICASHHLDENADVPCRIVAWP